MSARRFVSRTLPPLAAALALGCSGSSSSSGGTGPGPKIGSRSGPGLLTGPAADSRYYVASERGIQAFDRDWWPAGRVTATPAHRPRLSGDGIAFLSGNEIRWVERSGAGERAIAKIAPTLGSECGMPEVDGVADYVHSDGDFSVSGDGAAVCAVIQDRNDNMMSVRVLVRVDVATGEVAHRVDVADPTSLDDSADRGCHRAVTPEDEARFQCEGATRPAAGASVPAPDAAHPYGVVDGAIVRVGGRADQGAAGGEPALVLPGDDYFAEVASRSGRWALIAGDIEPGDYVYRKLLALDRQTGAVFPVRLGDWPAALTGDDSAGDVETHVVTGEDAVRALDGEQFLAGRWVIRAGERTVDIGGDLAY
jgi:hypothetical protein